jgi:DNA recombination protein RmuC
MEYFLALLNIMILFGIAVLILKQQSTPRDNIPLLIQRSTQELMLSLLDRLAKSEKNILNQNLEHQIQNLKTLQETLQQGREETKNSLREISGQVEKRLTEGFEKSTQTFTDIIKRLALIDEAQKKITELSSNVVSLKDLLADKRSRGAFGEVQLEGLIRNLLPESNFKFQHTLSNGTRADCVLILPSPTGNIAIDAKFPLENYQRLTDKSLGESDRKMAEMQFKKDIKTHIQDISSKYILPGETADGALMFIPAEAVFAEIHAHHPDLVQLAHQARVWMASPTTMMAILTTTRAVIKDEATRKQVHIIQEHLGFLAKDFERFDKRMEDLAKHIAQANEDVKNVNVSAKKITSRFGKIEQVDITGMGELQTKQAPELISELSDYAEINT